MVAPPRTIARKLAPPLKKGREQALVSFFLLRELPVQGS